MNLENLNVRELNTKEVKSLNGGSIFYWVRLYGGFNFASMNRRGEETQWA